MGLFFIGFIFIDLVIGILVHLSANICNVIYTGQEICVISLKKIRDEFYLHNPHNKNISSYPVHGCLQLSHTQ